MKARLMSPEYVWRGALAQAAGILGEGAGAGARAPFPGPQVSGFHGCGPVSSYDPSGLVGLQGCRARSACQPCPPTGVFQDGQSRTIRQFQFTDWPEQGVPKTGEGFIDFIGQVHKTKEQFGQDGPITVHCR